MGIKGEIFALELLRRFVLLSGESCSEKVGNIEEECNTKSFKLQLYNNKIHHGNLHPTVSNFSVCDFFQNFDLL